MTAQREDHIIVQRSKMVLVAHDLVGRAELFDPAEYKLAPVPINTACYRGFFCTYEVIDDALYLQKLTISRDTHCYPLVRFRRINGVRPVVAYKGSNVATYAGLRMMLPVTGTLRAARGMISSCRDNMGFHQVTDYRCVKDLQFDNGVLTCVRDISGLVSGLRDARKLVKKFLNRNWIRADWEEKLLQRAAIDDEDIDRAFERRFEAIDPSGIIAMLDEIQRDQNTPRWLVTNFADFYERAHRYFFTLRSLELLGCPLVVLAYLNGLKSRKITEQMVGITFMELLRTHLAGDLWGESLHYIVRRQFEQAQPPAPLVAEIGSKVSAISLDSWHECKGALPGT